MSIFCGGGDSRPRRQPTCRRHWPPFFFSWSLELRNRSTSEYQSVAHLHTNSFFSRMKSGFKNWSKNWEQKGDVAQQRRTWKMVKKIPGIQNRPAQLHESILSCLGPTIVQASRSFRCSCVDSVAQFNVHYDKRHARHLQLFFFFYFIY